MCARNKLFHNNKAHLPPDTANSFLHSRVYRRINLYCSQETFIIICMPVKWLIQIFKPFTEERIRASTDRDLLHCNPWMSGLLDSVSRLSFGALRKNILMDT